MALWGAIYQGFSYFHVTSLSGELLDTSRSRAARVVWLAALHTDMRKGFDGLALLVQEVLKRDPHSGICS